MAANLPQATPTFNQQFDQVHQQSDQVKMAEMQQQIQFLQSQVTQQPFSGQGYATPGNQQTVMQGKQGNANLASTVTQGNATQSLTGGMSSGLAGQQHQLFTAGPACMQNYDQTQSEVWGLGQNSGQNVQWGNNR
jgi:hypothetical protein